MTYDPADLNDPLAVLVPAQDQIEAAHLAQDIFTQVFRAAATPTQTTPQSLDQLRVRCEQWCQENPLAKAQALRLALLLQGLDQWGLAFSQAFNITAIPALTALIGSLRTRLDPVTEAHFQLQFESIEADESAAIDFKIVLRRQIHLALWHAMAAGADLQPVQAILQSLGSLLLSLDSGMPKLGWRLIADTLAHIQIYLLKAPDATALSQTGTQLLMDALGTALPQDHYERIMALASQAVLAWQQAERTKTND